MSSGPGVNAEAVLPWPVDVENASASTTSIILDSQPSCLEFSPYNTEYFVVGTYVLEADEKPENGTTEIPKEDEVTRKLQKRSGSLILFRLQEQNLYGVWRSIALEHTPRHSLGHSLTLVPTTDLVFKQ